MDAKPEMTIAELMKRFPNGFSIGPGTPDNAAVSLRYWKQGVFSS